MIAHLIQLGLIDGAGPSAAVEQPPVYAGGYGVSPSRRLTPEEDAALERALFGMEDSIRKARTPRVRRKKLIAAERYAEQASAIIAALPLPSPPLDLSDIREALSLIIAGQSSYPDWRQTLLAMARDAALELELMRADDDDMLAMVMMLAA